jgi:hypothetical protein
MRIQLERKGASIFTLQSSDVYGEAMQRMLAAVGRNMTYLWKLEHLSSTYFLKEYGEHLWLFRIVNGGRNFLTDCKKLQDNVRNFTLTAREF